MALNIQPVQVSNTAYVGNSRVSADFVVHRCLSSARFIGRKVEFPRLKSKHHLDPKGQSAISPKPKEFKVSSFQSDVHHCRDNAEDFRTGVSKSNVHISFSDGESGDVLSDPLDMYERRSLPYADSQGSEGSATSMTLVKKLFTKWLVMMRQRTGKGGAGTADVQPQFEHLEAAVNDEAQHKMQQQQSFAEMLKALVLYFVGLDPAISIPLLIFVPFYLTVRIRHGVEVANELRPLWVLGPPTVAVYVKLIQALLSLYLFLFVGAISVAKNLPVYSVTVYRFIAEGRLKALVWDPVARAATLDVWAFLRDKAVQIREWALEKYLDYVESVWPYYCRAIRFLKKARLL